MDEELRRIKQQKRKLLSKLWVTTNAELNYYTQSIKKIDEELKE